MSVKPRLTRRRERETSDYAGMVRRVLRAHGRRVADADPEDLAELVAMRDVGVRRAVHEEAGRLRDRQPSRLTVPDKGKQDRPS